MRVNLLRGHGSPTLYHHRKGCRCIPCRASQVAKSKKYHDEHRDELRAKSQRWREDNHDEVLERRRQRRREDPAIRAKEQQYRDDHREERNAKGRLRYQKEHPGARQFRIGIHVCGTDSEYRRGCRCDACRRAHADAENRRLTDQEKRELKNAADREWRRQHRDEINGRRRLRYAVDEDYRGRVLAIGSRRRHGVVGQHTAADVRAQFENQKGRCYWCKAKMKGKRGKHTWHVDHIVPVAKGGTDWPENIVCACAFCNQSKGAKHPVELGRLC